MRRIRFLFSGFSFKAPTFSFQPFQQFFATPADLSKYMGGVVNTSHTPYFFVRREIFYICYFFPRTEKFYADLRGSWALFSGRLSSSWRHINLYIFSASFLSCTLRIRLGNWQWLNELRKLMCNLAQTCFHFAGKFICIFGLIQFLRSFFSPYD